MSTQRTYIAVGNSQILQQIVRNYEILGNRHQVFPVR